MISLDRESWWVLDVTLLKQFIALLVVASLLAFGAYLFYFVKTHRGYDVPSSGMEPTILKDERIVVDAYAYDSAEPRRGDVVIIQHKPENLFMVKRVVAIGGDTIEAHHAHVLLNGQELDEPYIQHVNKIAVVRFMNDFGPVKVGPRRLFVMGDNRDIAYDSRQPEFGLVPTSELRGKLLTIGFSGTLSRIGKEVH